jgi:hypothetical protein
MKTFDTFEEVEGMNNCRKRPIVIQAKRMKEEFRVSSLEGDYKQGKPGDLLMRGIDGELYICDGPIFDITYDWIHDEQYRGTSSGRLNSTEWHEANIPKP